MDASLITIWGRSGAGKSTLAANLACALAKARCVGLISSNLQYGHLQVFFGQVIHNGKGLLNALENPANTKEYFWKAGSSALFENIFLLTPPNEYSGLQADTVAQEAVEEVIDRARAFFDVVIVDGCETITNPVSSTALSLSSQIITVHQPTVASGLWYRSMEDFIYQLHMEPKTLHVIQEIPMEVSGYVSALQIQPEAELPYLPDAQRLEDSGTPIYFDTQKHCRKYNKCVHQLVQNLRSREVIL